MERWRWSRKQHRETTYRLETEMILNFTGSRDDILSGREQLTRKKEAKCGSQHGYKSRKDIQTERPQDEVRL